MVETDVAFQAPHSHAAVLETAEAPELGRSGEMIEDPAGAIDKRPDRSANHPVDRSNETWLMSLRAKGPEQQAALDDLRNALLRGLSGAFSKYPHVHEAFLEDTVQEALIRVLDRLSQFEGRSRFVTWATSIAIRIGMSELRRHRWKDVSLDDVGAAQPSLIAEDAAAVDSALDLQSEQRVIVNKMYEVIHRQLTKKQRTALLAELKGMPQCEIGRHLGSNRNAVYKLTHDARKRLKRGLEEAGYHGDDIHAAFAG